MSKILSEFLFKEGHAWFTTEPIRNRFKNVEDIDVLEKYLIVSIETIIENNQLKKKIMDISGII